MLSISFFFLLYFSSIYSIEFSGSEISFKSFLSFLISFSISVISFSSYSGLKSFLTIDSSVSISLIANSAASEIFISFSRIFSLALSVTLSTFVLFVSLLGLLIDNRLSSKLETSLSSFVSDADTNSVFPVSSSLVLLTSLSLLPSSSFLFCPS